MSRCLAIRSRFDSFPLLNHCSRRNPLPQGTVSRSDWVLHDSVEHFHQWPESGCKDQQRHFANTTLPGNALSAYIMPTGANGRAVGLDTPPAMFANGTVGDGGPFDGIVTINSAVPFQFTRPVSMSNFDAQRATEHEIDEVIGLGSHSNGQAAISGRRTCSVGRPLEVEIPVRAARGIFRSMAAVPTSSISIRIRPAISVIG